MKKTILFVISLFAFLLLANSADAQMHKVSVRDVQKWSSKHGDIDAFRVNLPATGTSDSDYPKVKGSVFPGVRIWTLGELYDFLPRLAMSVNPKYNDMSRNNVKIIRTEFGKNFVSIEIHFKEPANNKEGYDFNFKTVFWCYLNDYGEITKSGQRKIGKYYYTKASH